ncbi:phospholipid carrier-dependent glycosyltransferase [Thermosynechococcaceae cyanobacterium BACA0444]|uniref:Phospholipid carrier-dependent glycosyltransferase n=1 Tax=Pseudocalidococcus azoricus BACA0444 TaxID=2918990 RepID=A0AAE4FUH1_9CYAN|nr:phospholipid carrier-dependent glycosyltransferase [Pseudocalidococcus azoricus]MDS3862118.1 phospholipid carrier-dependent glycosyltransferase [Pseudocalidococcus azoricus BACA0444]
MSKLLTRAIPRWRDPLILVILWLGATVFDRLWLSLDQGVPAWDQGDHLSRALDYWRAFWQPDFFSGQWWTNLWQLSPSYRAPLVYLATVPLLQIFGTGVDGAITVNVLFTGILLVATYGLGRLLFDRLTGLWAASFALLMPFLIQLRLDYLLDYGLVALVTVTFWGLTAWRGAFLRSQTITGGSWLWAGLTGGGLGLTILTKPTGILFFAVPLAWMLVAVIKAKSWGRWGQLFSLGLAALITAGFWFQANWLTILTSTDRSNRNWQPEGVIPGDVWSNWIYYLRQLPDLVTGPVLWLSLGSFLLWLGYTLWRGNIRINPRPWQSGAWLLIFLLGTYVLFSIPQNKDPRHIVPIVPILLVLLSRGFTVWSRAWAGLLPMLAAGLTLYWVLVNWFPIPILSQGGGRHLPYPGPMYPLAEVAQTINSSTPYLRGNLAVLPNTAAVNPMNLNYFGQRENFKVFAREVGFQELGVEKDLDDFQWFLVKTGEQGVDHNFAPGKATLERLVVNSPQLAITQAWNLPDGSELKLYHQRQPQITVARKDSRDLQVGLKQVQVPEKVNPQQNIPVIYEVCGPWEQLKNGVLVLTWQNQTNLAWVHDHGIGLGNLDAGQFPSRRQPEGNYCVQERLVMPTAANLTPGPYRLTATYLNRQTQAHYPLNTTATTALDPTTAPIPAPTPDLVSQFRQLIPSLRQGQLDPVFGNLNRMNQADPTQDYYQQLAAAAQFRLQSEPNNLDQLYILLLTQVLQRQAPQAETTALKITELDAENPYAWAYLAVIYLYQWQGGKAQMALDQVARLNPNLSELKTLNIVAAIMQLNLVQAWSLLRNS